MLDGKVRVHGSLGKSGIGGKIRRGGFFYIYFDFLYLRLKLTKPNFD